MSKILLANREFNASKEAEIFDFHIYDRFKIELTFTVKEETDKKTIKSNFRKALSNLKMLREEVEPIDFDRYLTVITNKLDEQKTHLLAQGVNITKDINNVSLYDAFKAELSASK